MKRPAAVSVTSKNPALRRKTYELTIEECEDLERLRRDVPGVAFTFWRKAAARRDLDYKTILGHAGGIRSKFTALPMGHGKHWCWPIPLACKRKPDLTGVIESA